MYVSHSRVECFESCPFKYRLRYVDERQTIEAYEADNALIIGKALHEGVEKGVSSAIKYYKSQFPILTDLHIHEIIKLENLIPKVHELLKDEKILTFEHPLWVEFRKDIFFKGFVDLIIDNGDGSIDVFDFKYSNNVDKYLQSPQLGLYKMFLESQGFEVRDLGLIFVPKTAIRQKKDEDLYMFRRRLKETLDNFQVAPVKVEYNTAQIDKWFGTVDKLLTTTSYEKKPTKLCDWCDYKKYCQEGDEIDMLPKNERRKIEGVSKKTLWWYGAPFTGKTTFANKFPEPLMLNTDGNIKFVDAPYLSIRDEVTVEGRLEKRKYAWEVFKDIIKELEKKQNDFKTIIVDLLEDCYEHCRVYMYNKLNIEHESDNSFKAWDMIRTEFLTTLRRLMNLDYENIILISHEDTSKDLMKKSGDKVTRIAPNLQEKAANKIAGMVDIVARIVNDDGRFMMFKNSDVVFGGGRLKATTDKIPLEYSELLKVYDEANAAVPKVQTDEEFAEETKTAVEETKKRRSSKKDKVTEPVQDETATVEEAPPAEQPEATPEQPSQEETTTRRRRTRSEG